MPRLPDALYPETVESLSIGPDPMQYGHDLDDFAECEEDLNFVYTTEAGTAIILNSKGYNAEGIVMMVGIGPDGAPVGAHVIKNAETPGIGDKVCADTAFIASSVSKIAAGSEPDINAGATKSSNGINNGIKRAVELYSKLKGEGVI